YVTGHTGFKGGWFLLLLNRLGATVHGYSLPPETNSIFHSINGSSLCTSTFGDILDIKKFEADILGFEPDIIFHFAAQPLVLPSYEDPVSTFEINSMGTVNLLESVRRLDKRCTVVVITTDKVYLNKELGSTFNEDAPLGGYDPYSASKAAAELIVNSYRHSFFNPSSYSQHGKSIATARSGNVIGGGDWSHNRIVPDIIRSISEGKKLLLRSPNAVRPWQHVLDPLMGYLYLAFYLSINPDSHFYNSAWNFGPTKDVNSSVEKLVQSMFQVFKKGIMEVKARSFYESELLELDSSKSQEHLKWSSKLNFKNS
ncbi:CDP-glucose 4,6-dehydratase, partial [Fulvivirga sp. RKSG066]|uniref:CDP-glucose 4,6-dehydratase n=1 Tax=Fulvivirga aurantia TaxID=2529383 RepID=UPI0012BB823B